MTIIHLTSTLGGGGAEQMVLQLAKQSNSEHKTIVVSLSNTLIALEPRFKNHNIEYYLLGVNSFKNKSLLNGLKQFKQIIGNLDDVVIHCHMYHAVLFGMLYKLRHPKQKLIFTLHSNMLEFTNKRLILFFTKALRFKDIIFSPKGHKWYLKSNAEIICNGVNFSDFNFGDRNKTSSVFNFLFIGRISHEKSPRRLIESAQQLLDQNISNFNIHFVGDGILKDAISREVKEKKLENHFTFHGFQHDIKPYLAEAHCLVLPSLWEGLPVVIIEAAASKLPVIATPVGSIPDFLNDNNAYVSELDNFHDAMISVYKNYDLALQKAVKLYNEIEAKFEIKNVFAKHLSVYKDSLKN
ncbi:glycosyltransferase [Psychroserpens sp. XS_ASV72]|uniref:glycosyltransferase n=1 Tax=Psychroserpens sp. XS_ASV72 TaxID=3241293 RepID=UPI003511FF1E